MVQQFFSFYPSIRSALRGLILGESLSRGECFIVIDNIDISYFWYHFHIAIVTMEYTPSVLLPIGFRSGMKYRSLARHKFSSEEKFWICQHVTNSCTDLEADLDLKIREFSMKYALQPAMIAQWIDIYAHSNDFDMPLCPVDSESIQVIQNVVAEGQRDDESFSSYQERLVQILQNELSKTTGHITTVKIHIIYCRTSVILF